MSETFKLKGTISISREEALKALGETSEKAEDTRSKLEDAFNKIAGYAEVAGARIGQGLQWGFNQIKNITIEGMNLSGAVEQGVGGAEAVFGQYADKIAEKAASAYESMGLSAAKYYTEANKMGSLFIGMGYDQAEAAEMTTTAMQRAADVAAIMGIDLEWAMYSVAGMAKGNYMMMDNLGVAMNATTLEAYALEKGLTVSWKEMTKAEQIGLAYEMFMERTAYAMGRYTEENNTYTGSINTAKAAWENFISGQMTMEEAFPHIKSAFDITMDRLEEILPHVVTGLKTFMDKLSPFLPGIMETITPVLVDAFTTVITGVVNNLPAIIEACGPALEKAWPLLLAYLGGKAAIKGGFNWLKDSAKGMFSGKGGTPVDGTATSVPTGGGGTLIAGFGAAKAAATAGMTLFPLLALPGLIDALTNPDKYDGSPEIFNGPAFQLKDGAKPENYSPYEMVKRMENYEKKKDLPEGFGGSSGSFGKPGASVFDVLSQYTFGKSGGFTGGDITPLATLLTNLNAKLDTVISYQAQGKTIVLNTGALVGGIGGMMDQQLGKMLQMKTRG